MREPLRQIRKNAGLSLDDLSEMTGIIKATLSMVERGINVPNMDTRDRIQAALGTKEINWLDTPMIDISPYSNVSPDWDQCERDFRRLLHRLATLPLEQRKSFVDSAIKHLKKLRTNDFL